MVLVVVIVAYVQRKIKVPALLIQAEVETSAAHLKKLIAKWASSTWGGEGAISSEESLELLL